jgi:hypothetical protein
MYPRQSADRPGNSGPPEAEASAFDLDAGPGGVVGRLEAWRVREIADTIRHLAGGGEPSGNASVASVVEPYESQGLVLRTDREAVWAAAYIRSVLTYGNPAQFRRWTARQAGYDHDRAVEVTTRYPAADGLPLELVPTRHGEVARTWLGRAFSEVVLRRPRHTAGTFQGTVHGVVGGWIASAPDGRRTSPVLHDYLDAEARLLLLRTGHRSRARHPWHLLAHGRPQGIPQAAPTQTAARIPPPPPPQPGRSGPRR